MPVSSNYFSLPASTTVRTTVEACFRQGNPRTYLRAVVSLEIEMATIRSNAPLNLSHRSERCRDIDSHPRLRSSRYRLASASSIVIHTYISRSQRYYGYPWLEETQIIRAHLANPRRESLSASITIRPPRCTIRKAKSARRKSKEGLERFKYEVARATGSRRIVQLTENDYVNDTTAG